MKRAVIGLVSSQRRATALAARLHEAGFRREEISLVSGDRAGATRGGTMDALLGLGVSQVDAERLRGRMLAGALLVAVHPLNGAAKLRAEGILLDGGAAVLRWDGDEDAIARSSSTSPGAERADHRRAPPASVWRS